VASARPNFRPRPARLSLRSLASDTAGAALIEITLFMPILVLMAVAIINFGLYFSYAIQLENAAQAGAQWAITNAAQEGYSSGSIQSTETGANNSSLPSVFTAICSGSGCSITRICGCPSSSAVTPTGAWATSPCVVGFSTATNCSDGSFPGTYIQVVASGTFTPFSNYGSFFRSSYSLSSTATVRVQ
jgi:Flp pilus assembly protein TadG